MKKAAFGIDRNGELTYYPPTFEEEKLFAVFWKHPQIWSLSFAENEKQ